MQISALQSRIDEVKQDSDGLAQDLLAYMGEPSKRSLCLYNILSRALMLLPESLYTRSLQVIEFYTSLSSEESISDDQMHGQAQF